MADKDETQGPAPESDDNGGSVFDLFDPPPERDPNSFGKIPVIKDDEIDLRESSAEVKAAADAEAAGLQHWTAPPTGQVPAVLSSEGEENGRWGHVKGPSWHGDDPSWDGPDLADVFADTAAVSIEDRSAADDDDDDEGEYGDAFETTTVQRPARAASSPRPVPDGDPTVPPPPSTRSTPRRQASAAAERRRAERAQARSVFDRDVAGDGTTAPGAAATPGTIATSGGATATPGAGTGSGRPAPTRQTADAQGQRQPASRPPTAGQRPADPRAADARTPDPRTADPRAAGARTPAGQRPGAVSAQRAPAGPVSDGPGNGARSARPPARPGATDGRSAPGRSPRPRSAADAVDLGDIEGLGPDAPEEQTLSGALAQARSVAPPRRPAAPDLDDIRFADDGAPADEAVRPTRQPSRPRPEPSDDRYDEYDEEIGLSSVGGRNLPQAIGVGLALAAIVLTAMFFGPYPTLLLVAVLALLAVLELYNAMRMAGLRPATLLGIVGTVAAPAAAYYRGDAAFPLIVALVVVFGTLWYLVGADTERPVLNLSLTMMGIFWVGGLASFAALMIRFDAGIELLLATIIITVASDTMAYIGGRAYGSRPFHHASPNKTWEGTMTGLVGSLFAGLAIGLTEMGTLWDGRLVPAIALGAVVGVLAPMGDLAESVVKRDLGVKDMGTLLPGHGGVLDRLDGLLFALPGAYYLALVYGLL